MRASQHDWASVARFVVGAFRADVTRAGLDAEVGNLIAELSSTYREFAALWQGNNVLRHGDTGGVKPWIVPIPGTTKPHRLEEDIGAATLSLTGGDLAAIASALEQIKVVGDRYPAHLQKTVNR